MTNSEKDSIRNLTKLLKDMYGIIASNSDNDVSYGKKNIIRMVDYLEGELANDIIGYKELINAVIEPYKSMFPPKGGLSEFHIWDNDYEVRYKANHEYEQIKAQIEAILSKGK